MNAIPLTLKQANDLVARLHRHHKPVVGHRFSIGAEVDGNIVGAIIVGRPVAAPGGSDRLRRVPGPALRRMHVLRGRVFSGSGCSKSPETWDQRGAVVAISEAVPLNDLGWHTMDLTKHHGAHWQKRRVKSEWLTLNRRPVAQPGALALPLPKRAGLE